MKGSKILKIRYLKTTIFTEKDWDNAKRPHEMKKKVSKLKRKKKNSRR